MPKFHLYATVTADIDLECVVEADTLEEAMEEANYSSSWNVPEFETPNISNVMDVEIYEAYSDAGVELELE